ncbi:MAG: hypothetical protein WCO05_01065 [Candidatus Moraniibacteriota bacterium]
MKRLSRVVFLLISVLVFMGSAPARGEWPNIGHTEYKGTERGGMDTTTGYYRDIWAGARAQKQKKGTFSSIFSADSQ